jgi:hypothetical protein
VKPTLRDWVNCKAFMSVRSSVILAKPTLRDWVNCKAAAIAKFSSYEIIGMAKPTLRDWVNCKVALIFSKVKYSRRGETGLGELG